MNEIISFLIKLHNVEKVKINQFSPRITGPTFTGTAFL